MRINLEIPQAEDPEGFFIPTLNKTGYALTQLDSFSLEFIEFARAQNGKVLEIGAAYGLATLTALARGIEVYCNDIEPKHLKIIEKQASGCDSSLLTTVLGAFPDEISFPENFFEAILISRVIHFFNGEVIEKAIQKMYQWLKPNGKVFIIADTPYLKNTSRFIPEYETRIKKGEKWPGLIANLSEYLDMPGDHFPSSIHLMDMPVLSRVLTTNGFEIEKLSLMNRTDYPENRRYDGRESVGAIARKPIIE